MAELFEWIDPDGVTTPLYGSTYTVSWKVSGRFSPATRFEEEGVPDQDGSRLRSVLFDTREFVLPIWVRGTSSANLRTNARALVSLMNPKRGDGKIRVTSTLGDQREITCRASSGFDGSEQLGDTSTPRAQLFAVSFRAQDPYWSDAADIVAGPWIVGTSTGSFFPIFPIRLSSSEVFAQVSVVNSGDDDSWPVWTITGPGASPKVRNLTTNKTTDLGSYFIAAGEVVTIDSRPTGPNQKTITSNINGNLYSNLTPTSDLWPLIRGTNQVSVEMGTATAGVTSVQMARRHRYLTP